MNTIWTFGDSFTFGDGCRPDKGIINGGLSYYKKYHTESCDIWPNILAKLSGYSIKNLGESGATNDVILDKIIDSYNFFDPTDVIIIEKTFFERFDVPYSHLNKFKSQYKQFIDGSKINIKDSKKLTYEEKQKLETIINFSMFFAGNDLFKKRHNKRFNFIETVLSKYVDKVYVWDVEDNLRKSIDTITNHSNNEFEDYHFSFIGHKQFADIMYNKLFLKNNTLI